MSFLGAWLVTEYVYNPDGTFVGLIRQRRELLQLDNGRIQVTQRCQPAAALDGHPMGRFIGTPVFELRRDGRYRRYHGPAVVGSGVTWDEGVMTGSGMWPEFGHNFRSFAFLVTPERQLTGGKFFNAAEMVANIVGVAEPERQGAEYPVLNGAERAGTLAQLWHGKARRVLANGEVVRETAVERQYAEDGGWREVTAGHPEQIFTIRRTAVFEGAGSRLIGAVKQTGWLLEAELHDSGGGSLHMQELLDAQTGWLVSLRRRLQDGVLKEVDLLRLQPVSN